RGENKVVYSVKNTFLHIDEPEEQEEDPLQSSSGPWASEEGLGPPLQFLPKDIELTELQAFRADYMKFRAGQATGARGEIQDVPEVPLASESTVGALDLQQTGQYPMNAFAGQQMPER
ncbi:Slc38a10, partial [Symbiodinium pilosum]